MDTLFATFDSMEIVTFMKHYFNVISEDVMYKYTKYILEKDVHESHYVVLGDNKEEQVIIITKYGHHLAAMVPDVPCIEGYNVCKAFLARSYDGIELFNYCVESDMRYMKLSEWKFGDYIPDDILEVFDESDESEDTYSRLYSECVSEDDDPYAELYLEGYVSSDASSVV